jgi:hypothetical protein
MMCAYSGGVCIGTLRGLRAGRALTEPSKGLDDVVPEHELRPVRLIELDDASDDPGDVFDLLGNPVRYGVMSCGVEPDGPCREDGAIPVKVATLVGAQG